MAGSEQDAIQPARRRRRGGRRVAGPPAAPGRPQAAAPPTAPDQAPLPVQPPTAGRTVDPMADAGPGPDTALLPADPEDAADPEGATGGEQGSPGAAPGHPPGPWHPSAMHGPGGPRQLGDRPVDRHAPSPSGADPARRAGRQAREDATERSLRSLVTTRATQVSPTTALRAREVALPTGADLAAAEAELVIVRRHYVPPTALTTGRRPDGPGRRGAGTHGGSGIQVVRGDPP